MKDKKAGLKATGVELEKAQNYVRNIQFDIKKCPTNKQQELESKSEHELKFRHFTFFAHQS